LLVKSAEAQHTLATDEKAKKTGFKKIPEHAQHLILNASSYHDFENAATTPSKALSKISKQKSIGSATSFLQFQLNNSYQVNFVPISALLASALYSGYLVQYGKNEMYILI